MPHMWLVKAPKDFDIYPQLAALYYPTNTDPHDPVNYIDHWFEGEFSFFQGEGFIDDYRTSRLRYDGLEMLSSGRLRFNFLWLPAPTQEEIDQAVRQLDEILDR